MADSNPAPGDQSLLTSVAAVLKNPQRIKRMKRQTKEAAMKSYTPKTELPPSTQLRKAVFGGSLYPMITHENQFSSPPSRDSVKGNSHQFMGTLKYCRHARLTFTIGLLVLAASLAWTQSVRGVELIQNGSFAAGMTGWKVAPKLAGWNPCASGDPSLTPSINDYAGILFYQDLNVTNTSLSSVALTLGLKKNYGSSGKSVAVYLDYATTNLQVKRLMVFNPENASFPDSVYTNMNIDVSLPTEASKVVRLLIGSQDSNNSFNLNLVSLSATGLSSAPLPTLTSVFPSTGAYYSISNSGLITLCGSNLGTTGQVFLATAPMDAVPLNATPLLTAQVVSWNNTQVVARVVEPMSSGKVYLLSGGVESQGDCYFTITSPLFTFSAVYPETTVLCSQTITALFRVDFLNGFQSADGLSAMLVFPVYAPPASTPLFRSGGYSFEINTSSLTNGDYIGLAQTLEGSSYARWAPFVLKVRSITNINFTVGYPAVAISSLVITCQKEFTYDFSYQLVDNTGATFTSSGTAPAVTITSDNPSVVMVVMSGYGPRVFALADGTANLLFSTPNGYSKTLPVTVNLPAAPRFTTASVSPSIADNSGLSTNTIYWQATEDPTWVGYEGSVGFSFDGIYRDYVNHAVTWTFGVPEATPPGTYLLDAELGDSVTESYVTLTVVNAASKGQIAGSILTVDSGGFFMHETMGSIEIYNASTGIIVRTNSVGNFNSDTYLASYITPGSYRVRWVPMGSGAPQWYPQATNFAQAATIQVLAGQTVTNINFYQRPAPVPPSNLCVPCPVANGSEFKFHLPTVFGVDYILEYKDDLTDTTWKPVQCISGNGSTMVIADPAPTAPQRLYRIRMQTP
jgi:hypothetical protein